MKNTASGRTKLDSMFYVPNRNQLYQGCTIYVARAKIKNGKYEYKNARPCHMCLHYMVMFGIKRVVYTTGCPNNPIRAVNLSEIIKEPLYISKGSMVIFEKNKCS